MHNENEMEELKKRMRKKLCDFYIQDCLKTPNMITHLHEFVEFLDIRVEEICRQELYEAKWHQRYQRLGQKINAMNISIPSKPEELREAVISISTVLGKGDTQQSNPLGTVAVLIDEVPNPCNVKLIASIAAVLYTVLEDLSPIPKDGRVKFCLDSRTVLFAGEHDDEIVIDLAKDLLGCGAQQ